MIHFVGAGSGAPDLITLRGAALVAEADYIIYAGSLVNPEILRHKKEECQVYDSAKMTLEEVLEVMSMAHHAQKECVRLHTGDPCLYGTIREQMDRLDEKQIPYDYTPGVSSFCAAASVLQTQYTLPDISQSVIITRMAGKTTVPQGEDIQSLARHQATMVIFLSASMTEKLQQQLLQGGYHQDTPAAIVYKATWPEEKCVRCTVGTLHSSALANHISKTALIVVGDVLSGMGYSRSKLYDPAFSTEFRQGTDTV